MKKNIFTMCLVLCQLCILFSCSNNSGKTRNNTGSVPNISIPEGVENQTVEFSLTASETAYMVTLNGRSADPIIKMTCKINDGAELDYADGTVQDISQGMLVGDVKTLVISAENKNGNASKIYYFRKTAVPPVIKPGPAYNAGENKTYLSIWSPDSSDVKITIDGTDYECARRPDTNGYKHIYGCSVPGNLHLEKYCFKINGMPVKDPYAVMIDNATQENVYIDLSQTNPSSAWAARPVLKEREDAVIYEVHIRDFTIDQNSGVTMKGKYLGMVETGTVVPATSVKTGIDHLKELGITHVQIMPFNDFAGGINSWGYDAVNFNIPEEQYSQYGNDMYVERIREVKTMINQLHVNGIRVIMDVSFLNAMRAFGYNPDTKKYYDPQMDTAVSGVADNSNVMINNFIRDSMEFWVSEYHVDGFSLHRAGSFRYDKVSEWCKYLNDACAAGQLLLYGEPWSSVSYDPNESVEVRPGTLPAMSLNNVHFGAFNKAYKESLLGNCDGSVMGYIFNADSIPVYVNEIMAGTRGSIVSIQKTDILSDTWSYMSAYDPEQSINYTSNHENYCLWDKIKLCGFDNDAGKEIDRFAAGVVLTSQGIPFLHAGDEMLETKVVNGNWDDAKNSDLKNDEVNAIHWQLKIDNASTAKYYSDLISLRKLNSNFRLNTWNEVISNITTTGMNPIDQNSSYKLIMNCLLTNPNASPWAKTLVICNSDTVTFNVLLAGTGTWKKIADKNGKLGSPTTHAAGSSFAVPPRSVNVFYQ